MTDFVTIQTDIDKIFEILGEHKLREEQLTIMIYKQSEDIEMLKRKLVSHMNDVDSAHRV